MRAELVSSSSVSLCPVRYVLLIIQDIDLSSECQKLLKEVNTHSYLNIVANEYNEITRIIEEEVVDAIIIDADITDCDCYENLSNFNDNDSLVHVPRIVLLGEANSNNEDIFYRYGAIDCVHKSNITSSCLHRSISVGIDKMNLTARINKTTEQLTIIARQAERSNNELIKATKSLSKKIKTSLSVTRESLDMLREQVGNNLSFDQHKMLSISIKSTDSISSSLDELSTVVQSNQKQNINTIKKKLHINELIQESVAAVQHYAGQKSIKITQKIDNKIPEILGDRFQIHKVLTTLIMNAIKHMEPHGELKIDARKETPISNYIIISVIDNGKGIHPNFLNHIFEELTPPEEMIGIGSIDRLDIGLHACEEIVEQHRGEIIVESCLGKGSKFVIKMPKYSADQIKNAN